MATGGAISRWRATIRSQAIITNPTSVANAIQVYCSSNPVGIPKFLKAGALRHEAGSSLPSHPGMPWMGAQPMNWVNAVTAKSQRPATSRLK